MAVSGYQNPIEYQMYSAFENKEEAITPVTTTSLAGTQQELPRSSLSILQSAGVQPTQRPAADILKGAGVTSAKDILRSTYVEKPGSLLEAEGISAASILEDYRKEQAAFKQQQRITDIATKAEEDLRKKEQEFIKNYKYDLPLYNDKTFETKFGTLSFNKGSVQQNRGSSTYWSPTESFSYLIRDDNYREYVFLPETYVMKGKEWGDKKVFNSGFLNKDALSYLYTEAQPIDVSALKGVQMRGDVFAEGLPHPGDFGKGFLFTKQQYSDFENTYLKDKFFDTYNFGVPYYNKTPILGIGVINDELVYIKDNFSEGRETYHNLHINKDGYANSTITTAPKEHGGIRGILQDGFQAFAKIPFGPEIAFFASYGNPAVYAAAKAAQISGSGGSPGDIIKGATIAYATASVGAEIGTYGDALGTSIQTASAGAISATVANTIGNAVVNAGFNGFIAAATGQDVKDAMLTGAISGGISANAATITNAVFGGAENVAAISKTLNLDVKQTQRIFTGSLASGAINSVVKNQSFIDAFTESLIVQGVSQSGANAVRNSLIGKIDPKAVRAIQDNTRIFLQATARAAVRGEDMATAIARVAPYLQGRAIGQTINIATTKK
jgi:hypothetical protein